MKVTLTCRMARPLWLAGCAVGPDYRAPKPQLPGSNHRLDDPQPSKTAAGAVNMRW
nr:Multidrug resistance protein B [Candidatus Pantoea persica]